MNQPKNEKDLFSPLPSFSAELSDMDRDDRPKQKPSARPDKPDHYYLMRLGEMENIYDTAAEAVKALKNSRLEKGDDVYLQDDEGKRLASKRLDDAPYDRATTSAVSNPTPRKDVVLELSDEMRHDLEAEGLDADRASAIEEQIEAQAEAKIEKQATTWREALERDTSAADPEEGAAADAGQPRAMTTPVNDAFAQLREASAALKTVRNMVVEQKGEPEWRRLLKEASDELNAGQSSSATDQARNVPAWRLQLEKVEQVQQPAATQTSVQVAHGPADPDIN